MDADGKNLQAAVVTARPPSENSEIPQETETRNPNPPGIDQVHNFVSDLSLSLHGRLRE